LRIAADARARGAARAGSGPAGSLSRAARDFQWGRRMSRRAVRASVRRAFWLLPLALLAGCAGVGPGDFATYRVFGDRPATYRGLALASGQIIVSESGGAMSLLFRLFEEDFHPYLHAGVIAREDDEFYVYHAVGTIKPSFAEAPTDRIQGGVRREPLLFYLERQRIAAIYDLPAGVDPQPLLAYVRHAYASGVPFDPYFDATESEKLYCTELVARALEVGGAPAVPLRARRVNASLTVLLDWLKIRSTALISTSDLIHPVRQVALVSRKYSAREIELHFATHAELHRRFTDDQRLGHLFVWTGTRLELRDSVAEFQRTALTLRATESELDADAVRREIELLATRVLGRFPPDDATPASAAIGGRGDYVY
jgi:hypothetical protein